MQYSWSKQRTLAHLSKHYPWLTKAQVDEYMKKPNATERSRFLSTLKYWRKKNV